MYKCLEVGPGTTPQTFNPRARVLCDYTVFVDIKPPKIKLRTDWDWVVAEASFLPIRNSVFIELHAHHVLEHSLNWTRALFELRRVAKRRGASIYVTVPNKFSRVAHADPTHRHFICFLDLAKMKRPLLAKVLYIPWLVTDLLPRPLRKLVTVLIGFILRDLHVVYKV